MGRIRFLKYFLDMGELNRARALFDETPEPDLRSWTLLISGYAKQGCPAEGVKLHSKLLRRGNPRPDDLSLIAAAVACGGASDLKMAREVHRDAVRLGFLYSAVPLGNALIDMYSKCSSPKEARSIFNAMPKLDVISWTCVISAFAEFPREAMRLQREMNFSGPKPNVFTLSTALSICSEMKAGNPGRELHCFAIRNCLHKSNFVVAGLVHMYGKCSAVHLARILFDSVPHRDAVTWNAMLSAYFSSGEHDKATELFKRMEEEGTVPSLASWNCMIGGLSESNKPVEALKLFLEMQNRKFKPNHITIASMLPACATFENIRSCMEIHAHSIRKRLTAKTDISTALVLAYARCGDLKLSSRVFSSIMRKDSVAWNTMILANSMHGRGQQALALFREMVDSGARPNEATFVAVLSGCSHSNLVEEGQKIFNSMARDHGVIPEADHYSCMVDILSRAGHLCEAHEFMQQMPFGPTVAAWGALLAGSRVYKNVELAKTAARRLFVIEPCNPGNYVLLSNTLQEAGLWEEASEIRKMMWDLDLEKQPGCSWWSGLGGPLVCWLGDGKVSRARI